MISRRLLRIKALQIFYAYYKNEGSTIKKSDKELSFSIEKSIDLYNYVLLLITEVKAHAEYRIDLKKNKRFPTKEDLNPNTTFIDNPVINKLEENLQFKSFVNKHCLSWDDIEDTPRKYYELLNETDFFKAYMSAENLTFADHKKLVLDFVTHLLVDNDDFMQMMEEKSIYWNDDFDFIFSMVIKTIKRIEEEDDEYTSLVGVFNNQEDLDFAQNLLRKSILKQVDYRTIIESNIVNWDVDRIANMDILIMVMAITEVLEFPSIPIKVTFDEYLEISKYYSTDKSCEFINGVLDKIIKQLKEEDKIQKVGRGLMQ